MIEVKNLTKRYGRVLAVDNISFDVDKGTVVGFLGPNGAGKSTTLKIITCFQPATSGTVTVNGHDVLAESLQVRASIGYMPEAAPLYPEMRVRELLTFRAAMRSIPRRRRKAAVDAVAQRCWLSEPKDVMRRRVGELSRGYKQRVGLAEALLHNPPVLVLDEPTVGLDPAQIRQTRKLIKELGADHTIILSSHILAEVEQTCSNLIVIAGGRIAATGTPTQLRRRVTGPSQVIAELRGAPQDELVASIKALEGVRDVAASQVGNWTRLTIQGNDQTDHRSAIYKLAADNGWQLRELRRQAKSLEDFFVQITYEQNMLTVNRQASA